MKTLTLILLAASVAVLPKTALSDPAAPQAAPSIPSADTPVSDGATPMAADDLDSVSAGKSVEVNVLTNQQLTASNSGNAVNAQSVVNGDISLSGSALNGYSGVGNFVMNTGNNNNVQGSVSVTIASSPVLP